MQTEEQRKASRVVANQLASDGRVNDWLVKKAKVDKGTVGAFLAGETWPRRATLARIEHALGWSVGTITDIAEGRSEPPVSAPAVDRAMISEARLLRELGRRLGLNVTIDADPADGELPTPS